jgi:hypothetical protein
MYFKACSVLIVAEYTSRKKKRVDIDIYTYRCSGRTKSREVMRSSLHPPGVHIHVQSLQDVSSGPIIVGFNQVMTYLVVGSCTITTPHKRLAPFPTCMYVHVWGVCVCTCVGCACVCRAV